MKNKKIILIVLICLIFLGVFFLNSQKKLPLPDLPLLKEEKKVEGQVTKTTPQANDLSFTDNIPGETSVYDFMSKLEEKGKINFTEKYYIGMGEFIDSINGIKNNQNQSWIYYVNGIEAQVGVSNYKIKTGDIVSFKYEKSY